MTRRAVRAARMFDGERLVDGGVLVLLDDGRIADVHRGRALRSHVAAGVTTVRDLGDRRGAVLRWRDREVQTICRRWWGRRAGHQRYL